MAVAMARRAAADMAVTVLPAVGDMVVVATVAAVVRARRRLGRRLGGDEEW